MNVLNSEIKLSSCIGADGAGAGYSSEYSSTGFVETVIVTGTSFSLMAPLIQLLYQSSDLISTAVPSSASSSQATASSTEPNGLSTGAKAGIGVGVALAVILVGTIGVAWWLKIRRGKKSVPDGAVPGGLSEGEEKQGPAELQGMHSTLLDPKVLDKPAELQVFHTPVELQALNEPAELAPETNHHPVELE